MRQRKNGTEGEREGKWKGEAAQLFATFLRRLSKLFSSHRGLQRVCVPFVATSC